MSDHPDNYPWLHVYAQTGPHDDAIIAGNEVALLALRDAINEVLDNETSNSKATLLTNDGEAYYIIIKKESCGDLDKRDLPYVDNFGEVLTYRALNKHLQNRLKALRPELEIPASYKKKAEED